MFRLPAWCRRLWSPSLGWSEVGVRFTAVLSGAVMLVGATVNWYALTDTFEASGLKVWFDNHLNYIPGFDELGISPFYETSSGR